MDASVTTRLASICFTARWERFDEVYGQRRSPDVTSEAYRVFLSRSGTASTVVLPVYVAWCRWHMGYPAEAVQLIEEAVQKARDLGHAHTTGQVLALASAVAIYLRDHDRCFALAEEGRDLARENGFPLWENIARITRAYALAKRGDPQIDEFNSAMQAAGGTGNRGGVSVILWVGAEIQRILGEPQQALRFLDLAFDVATPMGLLHWHPELHRLRGEIQADELGDLEAGEASLREAVEMAHRQESKTLELRAATSYGRFLKDRGRAAEARALLAPVYEWFTEGHDLPDLVDARALLDEVS